MTVKCIVLRRDPTTMAINRGGYTLWRNYTLCLWIQLMEEFIVFPPDFRVLEAGLVTGSNVSGFSILGLVDIQSHSQEEETAAP